MATCSRCNKNLGVFEKKFKITQRNNSGIIYCSNCNKEFNLLSQLLDAIEKSEKEKICILISEGVNLNSFIHDHNKLTFPLSVAAKNENLDIIRLLISKGVDINLKTPNGYTLLTQVCMGFQNAQNLVELLLKNGADVNVQSKIEGWSPLLAASNCLINGDNDKLVKMLIEAGADLDVCLKDGRTSLMMCANTGKIASVMQIIKNVVDINAKSNGLYTALHYACWRTKTDLEEDIFSQNKTYLGITIKIYDEHLTLKAREALYSMYCQEYKDFENNQHEIIEFLLKNGAKPSEQSSTEIGRAHV
jgi:ankyrin repeat protein